MLKQFNAFRTQITEATAVERSDHTEVIPNNYRPGRVEGTAIQHRNNVGSYSTNKADEVVHSIMKNPESNELYKAADEYSRNHLGHGYELHSMHPDSSLRKQYAIGQTYKAATEEKPEYKKAIFEDYSKNRPDIVKSTKAHDYDSLVQGSYKNLSKEVGKQFDALPVKTQFHEGHLGYHNSGEALRDMHLHSNLTVYRGGEPHQFLHHTDKETGLNENEKFRAVHDAFGHGIHGNQFGPKGEEVAHSAHQKLFTPASHVGLASETRGQNSFVNYSHHNLDLQQQMEHHRGAKREALKNDDHELANEHGKQVAHLGSQWKYADQKSVALPTAMLNPHYNGDVPEHVKPLLRDPKADHNPEYDVNADHLHLAKLAKFHNTSSHSGLKGGILNRENAHEDLKHIASVHGFQSLSHNPFKE